MDINFLRIAVTVASFLLFLLIVAWAWSDASRRRFAEAAQLPFAEDDAQTVRMETPGGSRA